MDRLQAKFEDRIEFIHLDIDRHETREVRKQFGIRGHTNYILIDADGNVLGRWFSYLNESQITGEIEEILASLESQTQVAQ